MVYASINLEHPGELFCELCEKGDWCGERAKDCCPIGAGEDRDVVIGADDRVIGRAGVEYDDFGA